MAQSAEEYYMEFIEQLESEIARLEKKDRINQLKISHCERNHAFCPDCRDKLEPNRCMRCENQRLRDALEFYADEENWYVTIDEPGCTGCLTHADGPDAPIVEDGGQKARKAMGREE